MGAQYETSYSADGSSPYGFRTTPDAPHIESGAWLVGNQFGAYAKGQSTYGVWGDGNIAGVVGSVNGGSDKPGVVGVNQGIGGGDGPGVAGFSRADIASGLPSGSDLGYGIGVIGASSEGVGGYTTLLCEK